MAHPTTSVPDPVLSSTNANLLDVTSADHFKSLLEQDLNRVSVLNFWAGWAKPCEKMNEAVKGLSGKFPSVLFLNVSCQSNVGIHRCGRDATRVASAGFGEVCDSSSSSLHGDGLTNVAKLLDWKVTLVQAHQRDSNVPQDLARCMEWA